MNNKLRKQYDYELIHMNHCYENGKLRCEGWMHEIKVVKNGE